MSDEMSRFPDHLITEVKRSQFHVIENGEIATEEDLNQLIELMFHYPERDFYLFAPKSTGVSNLVLGAEGCGVLRIETTEMLYYPHPKFERNWVRIDKSQPIWEWQKEVRETSQDVYAVHAQIDR